MNIKELIEKLSKSEEETRSDRYIDEEELRKIIQEREMQRKAYKYLSVELNVLYSLITLLEEKGIITEEELDEKLLELDPELYEKILKRYKLFKLKKELAKIKKQKDQNNNTANVDEKNKNHESDPNNQNSQESDSNKTQNQK